MKIVDFFKASLMLMFCFNLISCGDDNDSEKEGTDDAPKNGILNQMSADEKMLVGKWQADGNPLFLYSDKTCETPDNKVGNYSFNSDTKELITTSGWGIRIVKSLDNTTMVLQGVQTTKVWTYKRQGFVDKNAEELLIGRWQNTENPEKTIVFSSDSYVLDSKKGTYTVNKGKDRVYISIDKGNYIPNIVHLDCYTLELTGERLFKGTYKRVL